MQKNKQNCRVVTTRTRHVASGSWQSVIAVRTLHGEPLPSVALLRVPIMPRNSIMPPSGIISRCRAIQTFVLIKVFCSLEWLNGPFHCLINAWMWMKQIKLSVSLTPPRLPHLTHTATPHRHPVKTWLFCCTKKGCTGGDSMPIFSSWRRRHVLPSTVYCIIIILSPSIMKSSPALIGWYSPPEAAHPDSEAEWLETSMGGNAWK